MRAFPRLVGGVYLALTLLLGVSAATSSLKHGSAEVVQTAANGGNLTSKSAALQPQASNQQP